MAAAWTAAALLSKASRAGLKLKMQASDHDILLRVARGEEANRAPVWLMRQAGRYMKAFREYSDKYPFRQRSETPEIAIELSLQPWKAFGTDGVIMFSDILTPLPSMGIEFDVVKGSGPVIFDPIRSMDQIKSLKPIDDPDASVPFLREILQSLRKETDGKTTLLGFVGSPFTLAAYSVEGKADKNCFQTKKMMYNQPEILHAFLDHIAENIAAYAIHQIDCGAQVLQVFESWAHHLSPEDFLIFGKPYADKAISLIKQKHPNVPIIYFANGGSSYLELQRDMKADMICVDWKIDMATARKTLGDKPISGNVDPLILMGKESKIREAVRDCVHKARGVPHILNLGHGVIQPTPESAVAAFVDEAKKINFAQTKEPVSI
ncbi:plastid Uroporphyrinogen decarboxylase [Guillardia theta CCMP2712]|uniref:Uroporphyrinogen decarboxylase n=1 Tax=Guillardia theta (strain CCMP2712) TaxID=905079 RepID=L1K3R9_GUITC|nr:plastid Uroporphyrinogen decarboxylase [Guillardia theta CCMP2712]EKX55115.1 plastid Uroporphyrinogen decarboxylase [Guillardia theta CCMP2712]|eukprot:XP_005842095.1 plastid Uroporphyrinogen decarboxylase [Guillardia theta CCMP2712]